MACNLPILLLTLLAGAPGAIPPLDETQQRIIATAEDGSERLDEAAWYPLLRNATRWDAGDEAGARIPDYDALLNQPSAFRGEVFLIEGRFAGRPRALPLARPGPWGETVTEWVIQTDEENDEVAVVYLVNQPLDGDVRQPRVGQRVRVAARFYKVWDQRDLNNRPQQFLTFVGHALSFEPTSGIYGGTGASEYWPVALGLLVALSAAFFFGRRVLTMGKPRPLPSRVVREPYEEDEQQALDDEDPALPDDPDAALAELERRAAANRSRNM